MVCPNCNAEIEVKEKEIKYTLCERCNTVYKICEARSKPHLIFTNIAYCPICGDELKVNTDHKNSSFLYHPINQSIKRKWSDPFPLDFTNCNKVFHIVFDAFLILLSNSGQCNIFLEQELLITYSFGIPKLKIITLSYNNRRIVFQATDHSLYQIEISSLFQKEKPELLSDDIDTFYFDTFNDYLAYAKDKTITIKKNDNTEKVNEMGKIISICINRDYLFLLTFASNSFFMITRSLTEKRESKKTLISNENIKQIILSGTDKCLAVFIQQKDTMMLYAGLWNSLINNGINWEYIELDNHITDLLISSDDLIILKYLDRVEIKDIFNLKSGLRNKKIVITDMLSNDLYISLDGNYLSYAKRDTANTGYNNSLICLLSLSGGEEYIASSIANFIIDEYSWINGNLSSTFNKDGKFMLSWEKIIYEP